MIGHVEHKGVTSKIDLDIENETAYVTIPIKFKTAADINRIYRAVVDASLGPLEGKVEISVIW
jgi:hypothetical protein